MSEQQINQILKRMDQQDVQLKNISDKVDPMYTLFTNATGFNKISVWIMKGLAMVGAAIGALYLILEFFKRIGK